MLDPQQPQSWNAYAYVNNNPLNRIDPDGKGFWEKFNNWRKGFGWQTNAEVQAEEKVRREELARLAASTPSNLLYVQQNDGTYLAYDVNTLSREQVWVFSNNQRAGNVTRMTQRDYDMATKCVGELASLIGGYTPNVTVYRGGSTIDVRSNDVRIKDGLVQNARGPSLNMDPAKVEKYGGAFRIERIPDELKIIQRGIDPSHYEIVPKNPMPLEKFVELLKQVVIVPK